MSTHEFDFINICRLCLQPANDLVNIFTNDQCSFDSKKINLSSKIMACVSIRIRPTDPGPQKICGICLANINNWSEFNESCRVADNILQKYLTESTETDKLVTEKTYSINANHSIPEISLLSHDSFLERSVSLSSNLSSILNYCFSPTEGKTVNFDSQLVRDTNEFNCNIIDVEPSSDIGTSLVNNENIPCTPEETKAKKGYVCEFCKCSFSRFSSLLHHDESVHDAIVKKYTCKICDRLFISTSRLDLHKQLGHREKSFACNTCGKTFISAKSLSVHSRLHSEKYKCKTCGYLTTSKLYLDQHVRKHDGEPITFLCATCQKPFSHRSSLLRHENLHLKSKGKLFKCSICHLLVRSHSELVEHAMMVHKSPVRNHVCEICQKRYKSRKILSLHLKRHRTAQYTCDICDKKVHSKYDLCIHLGTHSNIKTFPCFHCDKLFSFKSTLIRHLKKHYSRIRSDVKI